MNNPESMIDVTRFGVVVDYLQNPNAPIDMILHAKDRPTLVELAQRLGEAYDCWPNSAEKIEDTVKEFISDGRLRVSSLEPMGPPANARIVELSCMPRAASCEVIYMPPFYLTHTPGLFEGSLHRNTATMRSETAAQKSASKRFKP